MTKVNQKIQTIPIGLLLLLNATERSIRVSRTFQHLQNVESGWIRRLDAEFGDNEEYRPLIDDMKALLSWKEGVIAKVSRVNSGHEIIKQVFTN